MKRNDLEEMYSSLGILETHLANNKLEICEEPNLNLLEVVEIDMEGCPFILEKNTAIACTI